jgi:hypothetical protein
VLSKAWPRRATNINEPEDPGSNQIECAQAQADFGCGRERPAAHHRQAILKKTFAQRCFSAASL